MNDVTDRINKLTVESTQTMLDSVYLAQRQNAALAQSYFSALEANQKTSRDLMGKAMTQAQEAQELWFQLARESYRNGVDTFTSMASFGAKQAADSVESVAKSVNNGAKKTEASVK